MYSRYPRERCVPISTLQRCLCHTDVSDFINDRNVFYKRLGSGFGSLVNVSFFQTAL